MIKFPQQVNRALKILTDCGYSAYVVGGAVRDKLMGKTASDWDITTSAMPSQTVEAFKGFRIIETGIKHGTVTVIIDGMSLEITTYRIENGYSDNRHPDSVSFTDRIEDDLMRRDFTVNAIAVSPQGETVDPYGGCNDIIKKIIKCVGEPDKRFDEDALRILRALRFASVLDFEIDPQTSESIMRKYPLLENVSAERIFSEMCKMLCGRGAGKILREYRKVIFFIFPELEPMCGCEQNCAFHDGDVWEHTVRTVESIKADADLRLAALLHDCGKPYCKITDENGTDHFYGHAGISREIGEKILLRMKASNRMREHICTLTEYHDFQPHKISKKTYRKYIGRLGIETVRDLFEVRRADCEAHAGWVYSGALEENEVGLKILEEIENGENCFSVKNLAVNGRELIESGIEPSKRMGDILNELLEEVMDDRLENKKETLLKRAAELNSAERRQNGNS